MPGKKNICFVSCFFPPHIGGVERYVQNLASQISSLGHNVSILTVNTESMGLYEEQNDLKIYRLPCYDVFKYRFPFIRKNDDYRYIINQLKEEHFDAIVLNQRFYRITKTAIQISKLTGSALHIIEHVTGHFTVHNKILDFFGHIYEHRITDFLKKHIDMAFGVSAACVKWLKHFDIHTDKIVYNGISEKPEIDKHISIYNEYNIPTNSNVFFHAGRLVEEKGIHLLIEAFSRVSEKQPNTYLIISGNGPLYDGLKRQNMKNLILTGMISHSKVLSIIKQSDCVVIPSYYPEGLPTLILEAGLCGTSVISTPMGGTKEVISDGINGIVVKERSAIEIADAMERIITDGQMQARISKELNKTVMQKYTWEKIAVQFMDYID